MQRGIAVDDRQEAEYLCAFLNAFAVEQFILGYAETTQIGTHITDYMKIPRFDPGNARHMALAEITERAMRGELSVQEARQGADMVLKEIF